jgi:hypothetical protein
MLMDRIHFVFTTIKDIERVFEILKEYQDSSKWVLMEQQDLYFWINVLNCFDTLLEEFIADVPKNKEKLLILLNFTCNLIEESNSRSIYSSCDRIKVLLDSEDPDIILASLNVLIAVIKMTYAKGKHTKVHEDKELLLKIQVLAEGFNSNNPLRLTLAELLNPEVFKGETIQFGVTSPKIQILHLKA